MAQNVIVPIIDLTSAAEGSTVPEILQTALAFGSQTAFTATTAGVTIANTAGFYRVIGTMNTYSSGKCTIEMSDGFSTKIIYALQGEAGIATTDSVNYDFVFFLAAGQSLIVKLSSTVARQFGSIRQIADVNGTLVNPSGFSPQ